ncbi:MAG: alpha/beta fold hydrolase [Acidiferrobacteraceae bacterium]
MTREYTIGIETARGSEEIHVLRSGQGPARFVVWHGFDSVNRFYDWAWLEPYGTVVRAGLPGHGPVRARPWRHYRRWDSGYFFDTAAGVCRRLFEGEPLILIGHSAGAQFALGGALREPGLVAGMILVSALIAPPYSRASQRLVRSRLWPVVGSLLLRHTRGRKRRSVDRHLAASRAMVVDHPRFSQDPRTRRFVAEGLADYRETPLRALVAASRVLISSDLRPLLAQARTPVPALILHGARDPVCPVSQAEWLAHHLPSAELVVMEQVGHIGYAEREDVFRQAVTRWLDAHPAAHGGGCEFGPSRGQ